MSDAPGEIGQTAVENLLKAGIDPSRWRGRLLLAALASALLHLALLQAATLEYNGREVTPHKDFAPPRRSLRVTLSAFPRAILSSGSVQSPAPQSDTPHKFERRTPVRQSQPLIRLDQTDPDEFVTSSGGMIELPGPAYLDSTALTEKPELLGDVILSTPPNLPIDFEGKLVLELWINSEGFVDTVIPDSIDVPLDIVESTARSFWKNVYAPGRLNGEAVNSKIRIEVLFHRQTDVPAATPRTLPTY